MLQGVDATLELVGVEVLDVAAVELVVLRRAERPRDDPSDDDLL
jgi:hypothetical protein